MWSYPSICRPSAVHIVYITPHCAPLSHGALMQPELTVSHVRYHRMLLSAQSAADG